MTNEEAIKILEKMKAYMMFPLSPLLEGKSKDEEAVDIAIEALEKQIPKKVKITTATKRCAVCGRQLSGIGNIHPERNFCQKCGQAIDWTEGE